MGENKIGFFEGWYFKHQSKNKTICIIPGISSDKCFIQVITNDNSYNIDFDKKFFSNKDDIRIENSVFSFNGIDLNISKNNFKMVGKLEYTDITRLKTDIMGFFKYFPMQCRHGIISMYHKVNGYIIINGEYIKFKDDTGYIEKDSGVSFPKEYFWVHSNDFKEKCSVVASIADIPFMGFNFQGIICAVWYKGIEYRLATYNGAKVVSFNEKHLILENRNCRVEIYIFNNKSYDLYAPDNGKMERIIKENPACKARFKFIFKNKIMFDFISENTSFEYAYDNFKK